MTLYREQIMAAVAGTLAGTVQVGSRIWRSRVEALSRAEAPAIIVSPGVNRTNEPDRTGQLSMCKLDHHLMIAVAVYVRGSIPDQLAAPIEEDVHKKLMADRSLGGLTMDLIYLRTTPEMEMADENSGFMVCEYMATYRTAVEDLGMP
jgi:hypothetical protein